MKEVISEVVEKFSSARNLKYSEILALDRKVRSFDPSDALRQSALLVDPNAAEDGVMWYLQQYADVMIKGNSEKMSFPKDKPGVADVFLLFYVPSNSSMMHI